MRHAQDFTPSRGSGPLAFTLVSLLMVLMSVESLRAAPPIAAAGPPPATAPAAHEPLAQEAHEPLADRQCRLSIELDPASGRLTGEALYELPDVARFLTEAGDLPVALDARLALERAAIDGLEARAQRSASAVDEPPTRPAHGSRWTIEIPAPDTAAPSDGSGAQHEHRASHGTVRRTVALRWSGVLRDDVAAGESPGRIHNLAMRAHVADEGVYLSPDAAWHPLLDASRSKGWGGPDAPLCQWTVEVRAPFPVVASGDPVRAQAEDLVATKAPRASEDWPIASPAADEADEDRGAPATGAGLSTWRTPFPQPAVAIAGGPLRPFERAHGATTLRALLRAGSEPHARALLEAAARYLDLYQPLLGAYPFREFTVVENFFSSGFAFPGFTLLSSQVIQMGERGLRPGYLDHELLHNWWGHGVLASRASGHWAEALASYCANYMRPVLEGRRDQARAQRRSVAETLSGSPALARQAVGDFGLDGEVSSFVGYQKGALVFDQLAARIGQDTVWAGLRRFFRDRIGQPSGWEHLRAAFEAESGHDLATFFGFWVDGPGLPSPRVEEAVWDGDAHEVRLDFAYADPVRIELPLRLHFGDPARDATAPTERVTIEPGDALLRVGSAERPVAIEIDPEFETLRRLPPELLMPTLSGLAPPFELALVVGGDDRAGYQVVAAAIAQRYRKTGRLERRERFARTLLGSGHVLVLGRAALDPELLRLFAPEGVDVWASGFAVAPVRYVSPGDAVLACVRNPSRAGAFVCLFWGNGDEALERADLLPFYGGNSLLVFDRGQPWKRRDFEAVERVEVR